MKKQDMEKMVNAGLDPESAIERFMGNETLYLKFLFRFPDDENYQNLCRFIEQQDCGNAFYSRSYIERSLWESFNKKHGRYFKGTGGISEKRRSSAGSEDDGRIERGL